MPSGRFWFSGGYTSSASTGILGHDPTLPESIEGFKKGEIKKFERHSRVGFVDHAGFLKEVARLRKVGFKRITLKTGAYGTQELAMALRWGAEAKIDLLTIDGAGVREGHRHPAYVMRAYRKEAEKILAQ